MSLGLLARQPLTWDSEAAAYILQVEAADGQSLEPGVARAINTFVIDCKVRGIWGAIKSCCLLSGARTLNGALRPLKGASPTNFSFTNSDYNRETGLKGNGTNQYLDTNFASSSLGLNNIHFCINLSSFNSNSGPSGARTYIADFGSNAIRSGTGFGQFRVNNINFLSYNEIATTNNFIGISRANSDFFTLRLKNTNTIWLSDSSSSTSVSFRLFGRYNGATMTEFSDGRISFYSIGESTDLRLLDQCVSNFNDSLYRLFYPTSLHPEALTWINSAQSNNNPRISATLANALNTFCNSIDSAGLRNKFYRLNLFCGNNLIAARIPLYRGPSPTGTQYGLTSESSINFTELDFTELGISGNGTNKYMETGFPVSVMSSLFPNNHLAVYCNNIPTAGRFIGLGDGDNTKDWRLFNFDSGSTFMHSIGGFPYGAAVFDNVTSNNLGLRIITRSSNNLQTLYRRGLSAGTNSTTVSVSNWSAQTVRLWADAVQNNSPSSLSNLRSCGYSIGLGLTAQEALDYNNIIETFNTTLSRKV